MSSLVKNAFNNLTPIGLIGKALDRNPAGTPETRRNANTTSLGGGQSVFDRRRGAGSRIVAGDDPLNINKPGYSTLR